MGLVDVLEWD